LSGWRTVSRKSFQGSKRFPHGISGGCVESISRIPAEIMWKKDSPALPLETPPVSQLPLRGGQALKTD
jgi:hypothetical protein